MNSESKLPWAWLVLGPNADMTSFTTLGCAPTHAMAVEIARTLGNDRRPALVVSAGMMFGGLTQANGRTSKVVPLQRPANRKGQDQ